MNTKKIPEQFKGLLTRALLPRNNPPDLDFPRYDLTPIDHDYAAQFQIKANYVFRTLGMDVGFVMMVGDPKKAEKIYDAFRYDPKYLGGGTGSGFKNRALVCLDMIDPLAQRIGAVNVVAKRNGQLYGFNTDGIGFVRGLQEFLATHFSRAYAPDGDLSLLKVLLLGAGGTADAIAFTLAQCGAHLSILNRTAEKAVKLVARINAVYGPVAFGGGEELLAKEIPKADIIVNASKKGAEGEFSDYSSFALATEGGLEENLRQSAEMVKLLRPGTVVCDVNLRKDESPTLRQARLAGHFVLDGTSMNYHQAVEALWLIHQEDFTRLKVTKEALAKLMAAAT